MTLEEQVQDLQEKVTSLESKDYIHEQAIFKLEAAIERLFADNRRLESIINNNYLEQQEVKDNYESIKKTIRELEEIFKDYIKAKKGLIDRG